MTDDRARERREMAGALFQEMFPRPSFVMQDWPLAFSDQENAELRRRVETHNTARQQAERRELEALAELDEVRAYLARELQELHAAQGLNLTAPHEVRRLTLELAKAREALAPIHHAASSALELFKSETFLRDALRRIADLAKGGSGA